MDHKNNTMITYGKLKVFSKYSYLSVGVIDYNGAQIVGCNSSPGYSQLYFGIQNNYVS